MRRPVVALVASALVAAGCSLPLPHGVRSVGEVPSKEQQSGDVLQVIPPGPKPGQQPTDIVRGFLGAQANSEHAHRIARSFLTASQAQLWDDTAGVEVLDLGSRTVEPKPAGGTGEAALSVTAPVTGRIDPDGSYSVRSGTLEEVYRLRKEGGQWRLSDVPPGLRLTPADRDRSFRPAEVFYPVLTAKAASPRLAADRVFVPVAADQAQVLVDRVLAAPTRRLQGTVTFRRGLVAAAVTTDGSGTVTVALAPAAAALTAADRAGLSAQLVWTLRQLAPRFRGLRLLVGGRPLRVPGQGEVQDAEAWDSYDPEGLGPSPPYYYAANRRLRSSGTLFASDATTGTAGVDGHIAVDGVAVSPDGAQIALLDGVAPGRVTLRTGTPRGPTYRRAVTGDALRSPSWGAGDRGLWLLTGHRGLALLPPGGSALQDVPISGAPAAGRFTALAASRDGTRVALVIGRRLYVGKVSDAGGRVRVSDLQPLVGVPPVTAVAWVSGTELAVLAVPFQLLRVAIDGSVVDTVNTAGHVATSLAASPAGLLLVAQGVIYRLTGRAPVKVANGTAAAYPG